MTSRKKDGSARAPRPRRAKAADVAKAVLRKAGGRKTDGKEPDVIVDFEFERGLFHVAVVNVSDRGAYRVAVTFEPPFRGLGGDVMTSSLPLFQGIAFLAPHKRIATFLDSSAAYFARQEPTCITATVQYDDVRGVTHRHHFVHDLAVYLGVSYLVGHDHHGAGPMSETRDSTSRFHRGGDRPPARTIPSPGDRHGHPSR